MPDNIDGHVYQAAFRLRTALAAVAGLKARLLPQHRKTLQIEQLRRDGVSISGFVTQNQSKARIVEALPFEHETIKIPNDPV